MLYQLDLHGFVKAYFDANILPLLMEKGQEYSGEELPALWNFHSAAGMWGTEPDEELLHQATKQFVALVRWSKRISEMRMAGKHLQEAVDRADDLIVYMFLLLFYLYEEVRNATSLHSGSDRPE